jgi:two-component system CheB/CheR fusion protein
VVNRDLQTQVWNRRAEDLWGLRREEVVGQYFLNLDFGLPTEQLLPLIRQAIHGHPTDGDAAPQEITLSAVNRRGRPITVRVVCTPLAGRDDEPAGAIIVMEQQDALTREAGAAQS